MFYLSHTLANGIRVVHKPDESPVAYCGLIINTGTRDEAPHEQGMAHFVEHLLFKGTARRRATHIINRLENVGGELNAYTNKEETVVYAVMLAEDFERAMELTADMVFNSIFPEYELEKEVEVILDEIMSYNDNPSELIFDDFETCLFPNSALGYNILGKEDLLKNYTRQDVLNFVKNNYYTDEIVFFSLGNIDFQKIVRWAEKYLGNQAKHLRSNPRQSPPKDKPAGEISLQKNTHQTHFMLGGRAYELPHPDRLGLYLLNNILGGPGMNSLLNLSLRERRGLAYNVESSYSAYTDTGVWATYLACDRKNINKCRQLVNSELQRLQQTLLPDSKLHKYKKQLMGQLAISSANKETLALNMGKSFLRFNEIESIDEIRTRLEKITAGQLQRIAREIFNTEELLALSYK
ncbi:MAG: insulinase family protein [Prevotellaceae bacterium]|jgi:predicted Zn-dependent peptidase|nr:insulinase family protein [Prevotellaceae bacterium]